MKSPYRGNNKYRTFLKAGKIITEKIAPLDGVVGVLGTGSIGRKFGDKYSDLDMTVIARSNYVKKLDKLVSIGWISCKGMEYDIEVMSYEKALKARSPSKFWSQINRWHLQNSQILHDTDNRIKELLKEKLVYPDWEQAELMKKYHQIVHEQIFFFPELWAERGQLYNVIEALTRGVQYMILWIYAKNKVFEPYINKWLFYHLENKTVPEHIHLDTLTEIYTKTPKSINSAMRLCKKLMKLSYELGMRYEVYSFEEAHHRTKNNWPKLSEESKKILSW